MTRSLVRDEDQFCIYRSVESSGTRVLWELTSACNLKCDFCLVEIKHRHLPVAAALAVADELIVAKVDKVLLSGGEPLLYPGTEAVMRRLDAGGVLVKLLTNGTVPAPSVFEFIRASGGIEVSLSLPTVDAAEADTIFGARNTLARIAATIDELPLSRTNVICAVSRLNLPGIAAVIDWVAARGLPCLSLTNIFKDPDSPARFRDDCRDHGIRPEERRALFALIAERRQRYTGRIVIRTTQFAMQPHERCMAGRTVFYIDPLGGVSPCTVTQNRFWREAVHGKSVGAAIAWYRANIADVPPSSCAPRLLAEARRGAFAAS